MAPSTLSSVDRTGSAIVLMQGSYDSRGKKVNEVRTYDVFGSHSWDNLRETHDYFVFAPRVLWLLLLMLNTGTRLILLGTAIVSRSTAWPDKAWV